MLYWNLEDKASASSSSTRSLKSLQTSSSMPADQTHISDADEAKITIRQSAFEALAPYTGRTCKHGRRNRENTGSNLLPQQNYWGSN